MPLEKRYDFLTLASGKKIQVPFDQLIIFSTNLEPKDLVDDAFLRRIPYKIEIGDPSIDEFRQLFQAACQVAGLRSTSRRRSTTWCRRTTARTTARCVAASRATC